MKNPETDAPAKILWNYLSLRDPLEKADCILALGSYDLRVAERGAEIFLQGYAPLLIFAGGFGRLTPPDWTKPEAVMYAEAAMKMGVPQENILIEDKSTNTGENIQLTARLLEEKGINVQSIILLHKPPMARRAYATIMKQWPGKKVIVNSPLINYEDYSTEYVDTDEMISIMVGDLQRIEKYPALGYQIPQEVPTEVWAAYDQLVAQGYTKYLI